MEKELVYSFFDGDGDEVYIHRKGQYIYITDQSTGGEGAVLDEIGADKLITYLTQLLTDMALEQGDADDLENIHIDKETH